MDPEKTGWRVVVPSVRPSSKGDFWRGNRAQIAAMSMAIYFQNLSVDERVSLTWRFVIRAKFCLGSDACAPFWTSTAQVVLATRCP